MKTTLKTILTFVILAALCFSIVSCNGGANKKVASEIFYISPEGDDSNTGLSPSKSWKTIEKINTQQFKPGDKVLFEGSKTFRGTIQFNKDDGGDSINPVVLGSYGEGRAIINGESGHGIFLTQTNGMIIQDINVVGNGRNENKRGVGIYLDSTLNVSVSSVDASGFQIAGILITRGSENIRVIKSNAHDNGYCGIGAGYYYGRRKTSKNIYVGYCKTYNNPGISDSTVNFRDQSGSGINYFNVDGGLIEYCEAYNNGYDFFHRDGNGPVGIWAASTNNLIIQNCISHDNKSYYIVKDKMYSDGGGYDFDSGMKNSIIQYCYSYNNSGAGILLCSYNAEERQRLENCIIRYNISENDGHMGHKSSLYIWQGQMHRNIQVYNNLFYNSGGRSIIGGNGITNGFYFRNNIFLLRDKSDFISGTGASNPVSEDSSGVAVRAVFQGNIYWNYTSEPSWNGIKSFTEWQLSGKEMLNGKSLGLNDDPLVLNFGYMNQITDPTKLIELSYNLDKLSPCIDYGIDLKVQFEIDPGDRDFFGNKLPSGSNPDIGPFEFKKN